MPANRLAALPLLANFILFQAAWFAAVLAPLGWAEAIATLTLIIHLRFIAHRHEWQLILITLLIGGAVDTTLAAVGLFSFNPATTFFTPAIVPLWLLLLWGNFATTLAHSLRWMQHHRLLVAIMGGVAGPLSYWGGVNISDKLIITTDLTYYFLTATPLWLVLCLILPHLSKKWMPSN